jgi:hypothetical protein
VSVRPSPRGLLALVAGGLTLGLVLLPSTAWAGDESPTDPLGGVPDAVGDVLGDTPVGDLPGNLPALPDGGGTPEDPPAAPAPQGGDDGGAPPLDPSAIEDLLAGLQAQGPFPEGCAEGVQAAIEKLVTDLTTPPEPPDQATLEQFLGDLESGLDDLQAGTPPTLPDPAEYGFPDLAGDVEGILTALQACIPASETPGPPTQNPPPSGGSPAGYSPPPAAPGPPAAPQAPVVYPGYAPTGAVHPAQQPGETGGLVFVGAVVLLAGAGAAGYRVVRTRAARGEG